MIERHLDSEKQTILSGSDSPQKAESRWNLYREQYIYDSTSFDRCAQCGYEILPQEEALKVYLTGDIIHRGCWSDYAEDGVFDLCDAYFAEEK